MLLAFVSIPAILSNSGTLWAVGFAAGLLAIYFAVVTGMEMWRKRRTRNWPTVAGAIAEVNTEFKPGGRDGVDYWRVHFVYNYTVDGKDYSGKYHVNCVTEDLGRKASAGLAQGQATVHYNPKDAGDAVLWEDEVWELW
jgi:hypothetical protein